MDPKLDIARDDPDGAHAPVLEVRADSF